ncbi:hypothetical protein TRV_05586 [Trichophyton verrucosum HKI 0517]|uniref:Protein kinase domain-containing protein n=1 Tax=Trichophyton verrucosum (strain HKI 0517) TaxID=663202 RepID=D4DEL9_TRIVH|nr:uncharacterized protein TRV_05586 [Trichophyton verrucosum HKI 0517]EFE39694.1 hypothetical protein TRV_05586 [Trichophyton verrucosum HKI 0517]
MSIRKQFPEVHWIWKGGISFVYEVHPRIVVKIPKSGDFEREQFQKELKIYEILSQRPTCPSIVQCFFYTDNGIFLEYMRVEKLEPLRLRKEWMNDLAQAVAFLESLNLAHGDLRPENILIDRDRLKLSDFDCTAEFGTDFETCMAPYGRILNSNEQDQGSCGGSGFLGCRTEQFALGSLYYFINYGFEVYDDQCLTEDPKEHGRKVVELLQNMEFPKLDGDDPLIDEIINKCWHNGYATIADLAACTETFLGRNNGRETEAEITNGEELDGCSRESRQNDLEDISSKRTFCQDLEKRGLLRMLSSGEPEQLGFTLEWYRHSIH